MATSGTYTWRPTVGEVIEEALERAEVTPTVDRIRSARRSLQVILLEWANVMPATWQIDRISLTLTSGDADFSPAAQYHDILAMVLRRANSDTPVESWGREDYLTMPNKTTTGRPQRYWADRQRDQIVVTLWPVPENSTDVVIYDAIRIPQDVSTQEEHPDIAKLFYPALFSRMASDLAIKWNAAKASFLMPLAAEAYHKALIENRERGDTRLVMVRGRR